MKVLISLSGSTATKVDVESTFHPVIVQGGKVFGKTKGATVVEIKTKLVGKVPKDQRKFMSLMESLGFISSWSNEENGWVIHNKK